MNTNAAEVEAGLVKCILPK